MTDVAVVGAGLFGSIIAKALRRAGRKVELIDDRRELSGSRPAACLMKPSWFSGLGPKIYRPALDKLDELYGVRDLELRVGPASALVHWVNPRDILGTEEVTEGRVVSIKQADKGWRVEYATKLGPVLDFPVRKVVIASGVWSGELVPVPGLSPRAGVAFTWEGQVPRGAESITPWAPYRQLVIFNRGPEEVWASDGTAIKVWKQEIEDLCCRRVTEAVGRASRALATVPPKRLVGLRPYVKDAKPAYLQEHMPGLWVATGGAKNGTIAAGWCAAQLVDTL